MCSGERPAATPRLSATRSGSVCLMTMSWRLTVSRSAWLGGAGLSPCRSERPFGLAAGGQRRRRSPIQDPLIGGGDPNVTVRERDVRVGIGDEALGELELV